jgi:polar amino acid transport system substrate-binding protein
MKEEPYQNNEQRILKHLPMAMIGINSTQVINRWNFKAMEITGICCDDAIGKPLGKAIPELKPYIENIAMNLENNASWTGSRIAMELQEKPLCFDIHCIPETSGSAGEGVIMLEDITIKVNLEEALMQSDKITSLGCLAAGMAHEINNPLAGILINAEVLRRRLTEHNQANLYAANINHLDFNHLKGYLEQREILTMIRDIQKSAEKASELVKNMLGFMHCGGPDMTYNHLPCILDEAHELLSVDYQIASGYDFKKIKVVKIVDESLPKVLCDKNRIKQVFVNLLKNSADAFVMHESPTEDPKIEICLRPEPGKIRIDITDNGPGIPKEIRERIFEPFVSTKPLGQGTGLGLWICYLIITATHGGNIHVESEAGKGTRFSIWLKTKQV